ncbi:type IV secretory system conjugative DNA transfer family protein [Campylobacter sp. MOP7]|uniref:type IV secretory system conjugative DNA transfer family protein n=1 Tax=Campylobacter canis TaxID=3378588 RepID=UPI00387E706D
MLKYARGAIEKIMPAPIPEVKEYSVDDFKIDIKKGLYLGAAIPLVGSETERRTIKPLYIDWGHTAGHVAVYGTTRVGKTRLMASMIKQCIERGMDVLVVEPKGAVGNKVDENDNDIGVGQETLGWITQFAEESGRLNDLKYVSPMFPKISECFNPLFGMSNEEISSLISTIIPAKEEFFTAMGYQITMCVLLGFEVLEKAHGKKYINKKIENEYKRHYGSEKTELEREEPRRPDIVDMVIDGENNIYANTIPPSRVLVTLADIAEWSTQSGIKGLLEQVRRQRKIDMQDLEAEEMRDLEILKEEAIRALSEIAQKDMGFFSKVSSSFNLIMSQLSTGNLGRILCSTKINPFRDGFMDRKRGQIVMIQPFPLIFKTASDAFVRIFFAMITSFYGNIGATGRGAPRELAFFVDEGGAVLFPGVEHAFNKIGGLGGRMFIFTQSFADYQSELGEEIAKIVNDNTNTKIFMRMNDNTSRQIVADTFGKIKAENNKYMGSKLDMRITATMDDREILLPAHMGDMQKQEFLLQYGEGRFYCCAPFQPDPDIMFIAPTIESEQIFGSMAPRFRPELDFSDSEEQYV